MLAAPNQPNKHTDDVLTIVISAQKTGHINQCKALCAAMGWTINKTITVPSSSQCQSTLRRTLLKSRELITQQINKPRLRQQKFIRVIASGRASIALVANFRKLYNDDLHAVYIGLPTTHQQIFDVILASNHERSGIDTEALAPRTVWMTGVPVITPNIDIDASERCFHTALIGGYNKAYQLEPEVIARQLAKVQANLTQNQRLQVVFSRRTPKKLIGKLERLLSGNKVHFVPCDDRQGFATAIAKANTFYVTPDSITMLCEVASSGLPVRVLECPLLKPDTPTARFVAEFLQQGYAGRFNDKLNAFRVYDGLNDVRTDISRLIGT